MIHRVRCRLIALVLACTLAGCAFRSADEAPRSTPAAPVWQAASATQTLRALGTAGAGLPRVAATPEAVQQAGRVADYLASQLHAFGVQPATEAYRLHYPVAATGAARPYLPLMIGLVGGRDPFAAEEVVIVYAALAADESDWIGPAAWLELSRAYAELVRFYRFPARSILFMMPVGAQHTAALDWYGRQPVWPPGQVRAVVSLGAAAPDAAAWHALGVPDSAEVVTLALPPAGEASPAARALELAREAYTWLLPHVAARETGTIL